MNKLTIDFETRSPVNLKKAGAWRYAESPLTEIICLAVKGNAESPKIWFPDDKLSLLKDTTERLFDDLLYHDVLKLIEKADIIEAHNIGFERAIWQHIMVRRFGFPELLLEKCRCSAAVAALYALPRSLEKAVEAIGLPQKKDMDGHKLMMKMCKPRVVKKKELEDITKSYDGLIFGAVKADYLDAKKNGFDTENARMYFLKYHEEPEQIVRLAEYCMQDVDTEYALSEALGELPEMELPIFLLDQKINEKGIPVDMESVNFIIERMAEEEVRLLKEMEELTDGIKSPKQTAVTLHWLNQRLEEPMRNIQKATVSELLERGGLPDEVRQVLEIRQALSKSSVAKFQSLQNMVCLDGRIRGTLLYCGAKTRRFGGRGFQPHNLPRAGFRYEKSVLRYVTDLSIPTSHILTAFEGMSIGEILSQLVRAMLYPDQSGNTELLVGDYSSIEARGLAWLVGDEKLLTVFRDGVDVYKTAAMDVYNKNYEDIDSAERQVGKVVILACGFQGWTGAFQQMAKAYGVNISDEKAEAIISAWRHKNPLITAFWQALDEAGRSAVENPGMMVRVKDRPNAQLITFLVENDRLKLTLPSGGVLTYSKPHIRELKDPYGRWKRTVCYWGVSSQEERLLEGNKVWGCLSIYGGKWAENIDQAICRDLLCHGILSLDASGYPLIFHVHDEAVAEVEKNKESLQAFCRIMSSVPYWAEGFPIEAKGWIGGRYRK